jgi:NAD+ synthase (glutamine-hydrolysing)
MFKNGFIKVAAITPKLKVGNPMYNVSEMVKLLQKNKASIVVFPELSVTAYTCNDLFFQDSLLRQSEEAIQFLLKNNPFEGMVVIGAPFEYEGALYNVAIVIQNDKILGIVPKLYLPNTGEFYEKRWFQSGLHIIDDVDEVVYLNQKVPFGLLVFEDEIHNVTFGIEVCEDMWAPFSPGNILSLNGARMILNLSASNEVLGKREVRRRAILDHSRRNAGGYVYCSAGVNESSSETVFSGHNVIAQNGEILIETEHFKQDSEIIYGDIDLVKIDFSRRTNASYRDSLHLYPHKVKKIPISIRKTTTYQFSKEFDKTPFVPKREELAAFEKVAALQENALIKRLKHIRTKHVVIGISGGLDSTLALLIAIRAFDAMKLDRKGIIAVTMPGLHTSNKTKNNALNLMNALKVTSKNIDINNHVKEHFSLIGHDGTTEDITYENTQARARTMILMNLANKYQGIVLGTGDLSELALGWCTYNGDQMSMYAINAGVPKTLVQFMIKMYALHKFDGDVSKTLLDIVDTPITPELRSNQKTEDSIGKYEINDFLIHRLLRHGDDSKRAAWLLPIVFDLSEEETSNYVTMFYKRFYSQQFKRQASPDGPKILDISVSPRGDLRLSSDIDHQG